MGGPLLREMPRALPSVKHLPAVSFPFFVRTEETRAVGVSKRCITGKKTGLPDFRRAGPSRITQIRLLATAEVDPRVLPFFPCHSPPPC